jgi:hypothetical protein
MDYQPHSPGLAPADFWLFPKLKQYGVLNNGQSNGNIVKNWSEITLKIVDCQYLQLLK